MTKLAVNIDHVATVRQARRALEPDPLAAAVLCELAGADGITVHLRADRRHIRDSDVRRLRETVTTKLNVEMAATDEMIGVALQIRPDQVTLVPERPDELTTEGGLDVKALKGVVASALRKLREGRIRVSLFIDPDPEQIRMAGSLAADAIEINTAQYSEASLRYVETADQAFQREHRKVAEAAELAASLNLRVLAGHGLTYRNVRPIAEIPLIEELNIGHNIVARATLVGMERAVREMLAILWGSG